VIETAIERIRRCGKPAGILTGDQALARRCIALGTLFTAVGVDAGILANETSRLSQAFKSTAAA
jgi:4-hydroxy-2-oxoheptanedioate aldolase